MVPMSSVGATGTNFQVLKQIFHFMVYLNKVLFDDRPPCVIGGV